MWILYDDLFTVWLIATTLAEVFDLLVHIESLLLGVAQRAYQLQARLRLAGYLHAQRVNLQARLLLLLLVQESQLIQG